MNGVTKHTGNCLWSLMIALNMSVSIFNWQFVNFLHVEKSLNDHPDL